MNKFKCILGRANYLSHDKRACQVSSNPNVGRPSQDLAQQVSGQWKLIGWPGLLGGSLRKPVLPWAHLKKQIVKWMTNDVGNSLIELINVHNDKWKKKRKEDEMNKKNFQM